MPLGCLNVVFISHPISLIWLERMKIPFLPSFLGDLRGVLDCARVCILKELQKHDYNGFT